MNFKMWKLNGMAGGLITVMVGLWGCSVVPPVATETNPGTALPKVVVSHSILCDLTHRIAAETLEIYCLMKPGEDPHGFELQPADRQVLESAELIFYGGYNLESNLIPTLKLIQTPAPKLAIHELAVPNPLMGKEHDHSHGEDDDHNHDDHDHETTLEDDQESEREMPDPHVWLDVKNGIEMVKVIETKLQEFHPTQQDLYRQNGQILIEELQTLDTWIQQQINTIPAPQRLLVTTHDAFGYYARAYGLKVGGVLQGVSTLEQATPQAIAQLSQQVQRTGVPVIFVETTVNPKLMETVSREAKVKLSAEKLYSGSLGEPGSGAETYTGMMKMNTCAIAHGLGGTCQK